MICTATLDVPLSGDYLEAFKECESTQDCTGVMAHDCSAHVTVDHPHPGREDKFFLCSTCASFTPKLETDADTCVSRRSVIPGKYC